MVMLPALPLLPRALGQPATLISAASIGLALLSSPPAHGVLFYTTADPDHNTTPPAGALADSGWQWQGEWGDFLGTSIAPRYFLTAGHIGAPLNPVFFFRGRAYTTLTNYVDPASDLRLWRVCGILPTFARLYRGTDEEGREAVAFGRGTQRGTNVATAGPLGSELKGWAWGPGDGRQRWGRNRVDAAVDDPTYGSLLRAGFDSDGLADECHLSGGDSGGGLFIDDATGWTLAGIHCCVDGPYRLSTGGNDIQAAVFDEGGLYVEETAGTWVLRPNLPLPQPGSFYSTRVSARLAWIDGVLAEPLPDEEKIALEAALDPVGPYETEPAALVNEVARTITLPAPAVPRFFRARSCFALVLSPPRKEGDQLVIQFE